MIDDERCVTSEWPMSDDNVVTVEDTVCIPIVCVRVVCVYRVHVMMRDGRLMMSNSMSSVV
jgi:hypothetical protein